MHPATLLAALAAVYVPVLAIPGPNFLAVSRASLDSRRRHALATALGVASGSTLLAALASAGVGLLLAGGGLLPRLLALLGAGYLLLMARSLWRQARQPAAADAGAASGGAADSLFAGYRNGLLTNLSNPKALVFFSTLFVALLGPHAPPALRLLAVAAVAALSTTWHLALATLFTHPAVRRAYGRARPLLLGCSALLIAGFGLRLLWQTRSGLL